MTDKDLKIIYKQETGKEIVEHIDFDVDCEELSDIEDYLHWLEEKVIQFENENYKLKIEVNLKNNDYELRKGLSNR